VRGLRRFRPIQGDGLTTPRVVSGLFSRRLQVALPRFPDTAGQHEQLKSRNPESLRCGTTMIYNPCSQSWSAWDQQLR